MPPLVEQTPLLNGNRRQRRGPSFFRKIVALLKGDGEPSWLSSYRWFLLGSWLNLLLLLVPVAAAAHYLNWDAPVRFALSFVAIIPLAKLVGIATEEMSLFLGPTLAGLLNATFGNAIEIIVGIVALFEGEVRIVQTAMLGSILSSVLLVLGCSFLAGGIYYHESTFPITGAQMGASLLTLACSTLVIPTAYHAAKYGNSLSKGDFAGAMSDGLISDLDEKAQRGLLVISRGTAVLLLGVYAAYLIFQLKTHASLFVTRKRRWILFDDDAARAQMNRLAAGLGLLVVTIATAFVADYLVESTEETANRFDIPKTFIGLIIIPIVANASQLITSVSMAKKNKMELTVGICLGSSIQIATFVVPLLVVVGWISGHELTLYFDDFEIVAFFVSVLLVNFLLQDGKSNYMEGLMSIALYLVIALAFWVS